MYSLPWESRAMGRKNRSHLKVWSLHTLKRKLFSCFNHVSIWATCNHSLSVSVCKCPWGSLAVQHFVSLLSTTEMESEIHLTSFLGTTCSIRVECTKGYFFTLSIYQLLLEYIIFATWFILFINLVFILQVFIFIWKWIGEWADIFILSLWF